MKQKEKKNKVKIHNKKTKKQKLIIGACAVALCLAVMAVAGALIDNSKKNDPSLLPVVQTEDDYLTKSFRNYYPTDFDADIMSDEEYTALDRQVKYTDSSGSTYSLEDVSESNLNEGQRFFKAYFDTVISGSYEEYPGMFSESYKNDTPGFEKYVDRVFPPQRVYNITVKEIARTDVDDTSYTYDGKPCVFGFYEVEFMILKNDGCFRRDLPENASRPLIFELVTFDAGTENEKTYIKNLYTPSSLVNNADNSAADDGTDADGADNAENN